MDGDLKKVGLFDYSQIAYASFFGYVASDPELQDDSDKMNMHKFFMLNTIRRLVKDFQLDEVIIAADSRSWRKDAFEYYKALRKPKSPDERFTIEDLHKSMAELYEGLGDYFPYYVFKYEGFEGDDIIACLTHNISKKSNVIVFSGDKDFKQLLQYPNTKIYNPIQDEYIECDNPKKFLFEHILKGDKGDGIPNFLSDDDTFIVDGKRQTPLTQKKIDNYRFSEQDFYKMLAKDKRLGDNFMRNYKLIKLPNHEMFQKFTKEVLPQMENKAVGQKNKDDFVKSIKKYCDSLDIKRFDDKIQDFIPRKYAIN